jgi:hypothetical protein
MSYLALRAGNPCGARKCGSDMKKLRQYARTSRGDANVRMYALSCSMRIEYGMGRGDPKSAERLFKLSYTQEHGRLSEWDYLSAFYSVGALMHDEKNAAWAQWYAYTRDFLVKVQAREGCWVIEYCLHCKVLATSLALLAMQMPNRLLPLYQY